MKRNERLLLFAVLLAFGVLGVAEFGLWNGATATEQQQAERRMPTLFIIGDSTVNNSTKGLLGWGTPIAEFFDTQRLGIQNRARGGRSSRTFWTEGLWGQAAAALKPGDFVLMQFGHNDGGPLNAGRARASLKGNGDETQEVVLEATGHKEVVHAYGWYLRQFIAETKAKGATPIVLSPVPRNIWQESEVARAANDYGKWAAESARAAGAFFVDLNELVARRYEASGAEQVKARYFLEAHTHTTPAGARLNAAAVVMGIRDLKDCPLTAFIKPDSLAEFSGEAKLLNR